MRKVAVFLGAAALAAGGCGGGSDDNGATADQTGSGPTRVEVIRSIGKPGRSTRRASTRPRPPAWSR